MQAAAALLSQLVHPVGTVAGHPANEVAGGVVALEGKLRGLGAEQGTVNADELLHLGTAIVHMVDSVVTKVELFDSDSMSSSWNQNMVIYQTINELSQKGFYDNSGLTMNQFLIIREILANEDILA